MAANIHDLSREDMFAIRILASLKGQLRRMHGICACPGQHSILGKDAMYGRQQTVLSGVGVAAAAITVSVGICAKRASVAVVSAAVAASLDANRADGREGKGREPSLVPASLPSLRT